MKPAGFVGVFELTSLLAPTLVHRPLDVMMGSIQRAEQINDPLPLGVPTKYFEPGGRIFHQRLVRIQQRLPVEVR